MITKNIPTYHCSYCSKYYIHKGNATRHENFCRHNPSNKHACFHLCRHLIREKQDTEYTEYMVRPPQMTVFTCAITKQKMYSFLAEKKKLPTKHKASYEDTVRMPLECPHYEVQTMEDFEF